MALRSRRLNHLPPLQYAVNDHYVTLRIHNGGELVHTPVPEYLCGTYQINREIVLYLDAIQDTPEFDFGPNEPPAENEKEMEIFEANDWETIFKILDIVAEGAEGDAVRGGDGGGWERGVAGDASSSFEFISDEDIIGSGDDFESEYENEEGDCKAVFNASEKYDPNFEIGMSFSSKSDFKDAVYGHAVKTKRSLKITKNDSRRIYARCDGEGCEWRINVLKVIGETTFQIREYNSVHTCARSFNVKNVNSGWLSKKYEDSFRTDPNRAVKGFRKDVIKDIRCNVSKYQAYRAKRKALNAIDGAADDQFALLWDYAEELRKSNPRSNVIMMMTDSDDGNVNKKFAKFYVMFDALRVGFLSGCRPIIGVDGCHLKGPHGEDAYTFISDKQKGLIPAFESVFPGSDKRYCVRHLHGNMKTAGFKGLAYKSALWNVARATTESEFKKFSCSCRKWDLTGIPCNHAMSAICSQVLDPEDFVNPCYSVQTFKKVYRYAIMPVNGPKLWAQTGNIPPLPPNFGRKAGRPSRARRMEPDEIPNKQRRSSKRGQKKPIKLKRQSFKVKCHYCGGTGHNQKGCDKKKEDGQNQPQKRLTKPGKGPFQLPYCKVRSLYLLEASPLHKESKVKKLMLWKNRLEANPLHKKSKVKKLMLWKNREWESSTFSNKRRKKYISGGTKSAIFPKEKDVGVAVAAGGWGGGDRSGLRRRSAEEMDGDRRARGREEEQAELSGGEEARPGGRDGEGGGGGQICRSGRGREARFGNGRGGGCDHRKEEVAAARGRWEGS
ncbi:hypothetical protein Sango_2769200 [Sesamum angolense]|uniref:SWIM-type domain-containing protein n=1 Tax=Sesamum angolense TaxID=2727404 RepID=A0AAE1T956_9LAMI|nr:hypothetical protein Sango_2769200 [Sesamum angolense]